MDEELEDEVGNELTKYGNVTSVMIFEVTTPGYAAEEAVRIFIQVRTEPSYLARHPSLPAASCKCVCCFWFKGTGRAVLLFSGWCSNHLVEHVGQPRLPWQGSRWLTLFKFEFVCSCLVCAV